MTDGPSMRLLHFLRKLRKLLQVALAPTGGLQYVTRYRIVPCTAAKVQNCADELTRVCLIIPLLMFLLATSLHNLIRYHHRDVNPNVA